METLGKIFLGLGAVAVVAGATYVLTKKTEEKDDESLNIDPATVEEDKNVVKKIKAAAHKRMLKICAWVLLHKEQIEAVAAVVGLLTSVIKVASAAKEYITGSKMKETLTDMQIELKDIHLEIDHVEHIIEEGV